MAQHYKNPGITKSRVNVFLGWEHFNPKGNVAPGRMDQNLCGRLWTSRTRTPVTIAVASPDAPLTNPTSKLLESLTYRPAAIGDRFGPTFATHIFRLDIIIPPLLHDRPAHLLWDSNSEALVLSAHGEPLQGLVGGDHWARRADYPLFPDRVDSVAREGEHVRLYVEIACNGLFGAGRGGDIEPPEMDRFYQLEECCLAVFDPTAWALIHDLTLLSGLTEHLPESPRRAHALHVANEVVNAVQVDDPETYARGRDIAATFLCSKNGEAQAVVHSMLHSHIDLAWLWPMASTPGKGARTFATQLRLLDTYPDAVYVQSQAQLYQWVKERYPTLWKEVRQRVAEGRFVPVGGTWVEMDCNIPSGESLVRQFVIGQKFFNDNFGIRCKEFWLPDTFGYCGQLPQIMKGCGVDHFLTQKLSWNLFNKFPHSSFVWEGLDGTRVLAHMPPADTYNAQAFPDEVLRSAQKNKDSGLFHSSIMLVGHGDGGGGASPAMLESMKRMKNVDGVPRVQFSTPDKFFGELRKRERDLPRWVGELYFELHRGTYTTQARTKRKNRECEILLRDLESISTQAVILAKTSGLKFSYPSELLDTCWKLILKNCFHDTLPGSCIALVYEETHRDYSYVLKYASEAIQRALDFIEEAVSNDSLTTDLAAKRMKLANGAAVLNGVQGIEGSIISEGSTSKSYYLIQRGIGMRKSRCSTLTIETQLSKDDLPANALVQSCRSLGNDTGENGEKDQADYRSLVAVKARSHGLGVATPTEILLESSMDDNFCRSTIEKLRLQDSHEFLLTNRYVQARVNSSGRVTSLILRSSNGATREAISQSSRDNSSSSHGNRLVLYDDVPQFWCGWDTEVYSFEKSYEILPAAISEVIEEGPLRVGVYLIYPPTKAGSVIRQYIFLRAESSQLEFHTEVDWCESRKILRVLFNTKVKSPTANYGSQFGFVSRPTTFNHSWDIAKFEAVGHQYCDFSEPGFGVALLSDYKYGFSVRDATMRLSLLRASKSPDDTADLGKQTFRYAIMPHWHSFPTSEVVEGAAELGCPPSLRKARRNEESTHIRSDFDLTFSVDGSVDDNLLDSVLISAVKMSERNAQSIVVRLYESLGARGTARLQCPPGVDCKTARMCNMLEDAFESQTIEELHGSTTIQAQGESELVVKFNPFQILTIMMDIVAK